MDKLLEKHVVARFISLVLAFFLWLSVVNEQNPEIDRTLLVQPQLRGMSTELVLFNEIEDVSLRLRGRRNDILGIAPGDLEVYVSLSEAAEGENNLEVRLGRIPVGMQLVEIVPAHITVLTEKIIQEQRPIQLSVKGEPAAGHVLGEGILAPSQAMVEGPRSQVEQIGRIVARVDVTDAVADIQKVALLQALSKQGNTMGEDVIIRPEVAEIKIAVAELPSKILEIRPRIVGQVEDGYQIEEVIVAPSELRVYAPPELLDRLSHIETTTIDIDRATADINLETRLLVPGGVQLPFNRTWVTVKVSPRIGERRIREVPVKVNNLGNGLVAEVEPRTIAVIVSGFANLINSLQPGDIVAFIDAANLEIGEYRIPVQMDFPTGVREGIAEPGEITIVIEALEG